MESANTAMRELSLEVEGQSTLLREKQILLVLLRKNKPPTHYSSTRTETAHSPPVFFLYAQPRNKIYWPPLSALFLAKGQSHSREANGKKPSPDFNKNIAGAEVPKNEHRWQFQLEFLICLVHLVPFHYSPAWSPGTATIVWAGICTRPVTLSPGEAPVSQLSQFRVSYCSLQPLPYPNCTSEPRF